LFRRLGKWKLRPDVNRLRLGSNKQQRSTPLPRHPSIERCVGLGISTLWGSFNLDMRGRTVEHGCMQRVVARYVQERDKACS
jgi:hypothetical protein